jgi:hypothetical protein
MGLGIEIPKAHPFGETLPPVVLRPRIVLELMGCAFGLSIPSKSEKRSGIMKSRFSRLRFCSQSLAVQLLIFLMLMTPVGAQTVANNGPVPGTPAAADKKPAANSAPAVGELQTKQDAPPPQVAGAATRPAESRIEPGQTNVEIRYDVQGVSVQGNTDRSFLHACTRDQILPFIGLTTPARPRLCNSINNVGEISFLNNVPVFGNYRFETSVVTRYTDNPRVDPERESLQRGYLRLTGANMEATLGDSLVNYSRLSFSQNIKGFHAWRQWSKNVKVTGTIGAFADRWGSLYRHYTAFRDITLDCRSASTFGTPGATPPSGPPFAAAGGCIEDPPGSQNFVVSPANPFKPYSRFVAGFRLERKVGRNGWVAVNYSRGKDVLESLPDALITCVDASTSTRRIADIGIGCTATEFEFLNHRFSAPEATNNHLISFDTNFEIQPWRLKVISEVAYASTAGGTPPPQVACMNGLAVVTSRLASPGCLPGETVQGPATVINPALFACASQPPVVGAAVLDSRCFKTFVRDPAYRAEVSQRVAKLNWRLDYSRFQPNFSSANARQIRDLQDFNVRGDYQFIPRFGLALSWRRSNDNLNGQRNYTSIVRAPEVRLTFRDLPFYRRMVFEAGYRERNLDTAGNPLTCVTPPVPPATTPVTTFRTARTGCLSTETLTANNERVRSTRIPFFSFTLPVGSTSLNFDYEHRYDRDAVIRQNSTGTNRFAFGFRGNYNWNNWDVFPSLRFELERLGKHTPSNASLASSDPSLNFPTDFFGAQDTSRSINAQLQIEAPRYFRFEAIYREFNSISLSALKASALFDPLQRFFYLNQGFKRPYWRTALSYKFRNDENRLFTFYYERGNNFFDTGDPFVTDLKSFRETIIGGTILFRFRH